MSFNAQRCHLFPSVNGGLSAAEASRRRAATRFPEAQPAEALGLTIALPLIGRADEVIA